LLSFKSGFVYPLKCTKLIGLILMDPSISYIASRRVKQRNSLLECNLEEYGFAHNW